MTWSGANLEFRVLATDLLAGRPQLALLAASDSENRTGQGDDLPLRFALNDDELHFHEEPSRP